MKRILFVFLISIVSFSCSNESYDATTVEGKWKLTAYNVADGFDINNDGIKSINVLDEIDCVSNEFLTFESNGVMYSDSTFNPDIRIALLDGTTNEYAFNITCDQEGVIGFATNYTQKGDTITYNNRKVSIIGNQLYVEYKNGIKIYNENFTKVVGTKDLTMVYTKQ